jgi:hypothetical protein
MSAYVVSDHAFASCWEDGLLIALPCWTGPYHLLPGAAAVEVVVGSSVPCASDFCKESGGALPSLALTTRGQRGNNDLVLLIMSVAILSPLQRIVVLSLSREMGLGIRHFLH